VVPTPSADVSLRCPNVGLLIGAEASSTDPRSGVSVKLTPSASVTDRVFEKGVYKSHKGGYPPSRRESSAPFEPPDKIKEEFGGGKPREAGMPPVFRYQFVDIPSMPDVGFRFRAYADER